MSQNLESTSRTILELIATVMDSAFAVLGEGVVLGTMPPYLQSFGARNAQYLEKRFGPFQAATGAVAALAPLNLVSQTTGTPYLLVDREANHATKRLTACEFADAFGRKSPFARTMICQLHRAVYQGSVNSLLAKGHSGYDVKLSSRILFGDAHCDFEVKSKKPIPGGEQADSVPPSPDDLKPADALAFYTAILVGFVDYLSTVLPGDELESVLTGSARRVGAKLHEIYVAPGDATTPTDANGILSKILAQGGRTVESKPTLPIVRVTACPLAQPITSTTKTRGAEASTIRKAACLLCVESLQGAIDIGNPGLRVVRDSALTLGQNDCQFRTIARHP